MRISAIPLCVGFISGALLVPSDCISQTETVNTSLCGCQPGAGSPCPGATNYQLCTFALNITSGCPSFTAINAFTTSGTYVAADILNFKLYETNFSVFNTTTLVATIAAGLGPGAHSFTGFNRTTCAAAQRYYWITADFSATAVAGHTIKIDLITAGMYAITGTLTYGTNTAAGLQTICNPLPVELISFTGKKENGKTILAWQTASETNNDFFTVERSDDGISFITIATVNGAGTSSQLNFYSAADNRGDYFPVSYYRLRQTDFNGQSEYAGGILAVSSETIDSPVTIQTTGNSLRVRQQDGDLDYIIYDINGRSCRSGTLKQGEAEVDLSGLSPGIYMLRLDNKAQTSELFCKTPE
jgi:hypothetical protein